MRKDKTTMKSILQNARAMRTASLSGRKKTQNNSLTRLPSNNFQMQQTPLNWSQSQIFNSNLINKHQSYEKMPSRFSYQVSQTDSISNHMRNYYQPYKRPYMNQSIQFPNISQINDSYSNLTREPNKQISYRPKRNKKEMSIEILNQINQELLKSIRQPKQLLKIKNKIKENLSTFKTQPRIKLVELLKK